MIDNKIVVFCNMVADLFHYGHMSFIKKVKEEALKRSIKNNIKCDGVYVIVGLNSDEDCVGYKRKPIMTFEERKETIKMSGLADLVLEHPVPLVDTVEYLDSLNIDYTSHGDDFDQEKMTKYYGELINANRMIIVPYERHFKISTTELINRINKLNS